MLLEEQIIKLEKLKCEKKIDNAFFCGYRETLTSNRST